MRNGIRQRLIAEIPAVGGRVLDRHEAEGAVDKPYLVLAQGIETEEEGWPGWRRTYKVWPYADRTVGFAAVDALCEAIIRALHEVRLTDPDSGETFTCRYQGAIGTERADGKLDALTHGLRFRVDAVHPEGLAETAPADPWLEALGAWTSQSLGAPWRVYLGRWPTDYERPAVLWRLEGVEALLGNAAAAETRKRFVGHVLGRSDGERETGVAALAERLALAGKLALNAGERRYMTVRSQAADPSADEWTEGQVRLTLGRRVLRPHEEEPLMEEVAFRRSIR
ncbi:hypothetical protein [Cohnella sp. REN36]|uniref:hypothetical protein n=1 Tax=Cohnella sp. REN36 TaxID=2887347 RepID=UPI001D150BEA|nr:hypothetical protein [Cohnella sp. REN36]MCC3374731.1 hypothetical protein [Cohnella sp. REN36]